MSRGIVRFLEALPTGIEQGQSMVARNVALENARIERDRNRDMRAAEQGVSALLADGPQTFDSGTFRRPEHTQAGDLPMSPTQGVPQALGGGRERFRPEAAEGIAAGAGRARQTTDFRSWENQVMQAAAQSGNLEYMQMARDWASNQRTGMINEALAGVSRAASMGDMEGAAATLRDAIQFLPGLENFDADFEVRDGQLVMPNGTAMDAMDVQLMTAELLRMGDPVAMSEWATEQARADRAEERDDRRVSVAESQVELGRAQLEEGIRQFDLFWPYKVDQAKAGILRDLAQADAAQAGRGGGGRSAADLDRRWGNIDDALTRRFGELPEITRRSSPEERLRSDMLQNTQAQQRMRSIAQQLVPINDDTLGPEVIADVATELFIATMTGSPDEDIENLYEAFPTDENGQVIEGAPSVLVYRHRGQEVVVPQDLVNHLAQINEAMNQAGQETPQPFTPSNPTFADRERELRALTPQTPEFALPPNPVMQELEAVRTREQQQREMSDVAQALRVMERGQ